MPILDLSLVTQALANLILRRVTTGLNKLGQSTTNLKVSFLPTDRLTGDRTIGLYLYHVLESAYTKNQPPASADPPPIQFTPMGLDLFYQLTAHADPVEDSPAGETAAARAQLLFGLALKALHDFASIDKDTVVDGLPVFPSGWQDENDRIRISLEPVPEKDSTHYWTAGSQPLRLAAYYQVSATLLEPEKPGTFSGRVLRYGIPTFVTGAPRLDASASDVVFRVPGETSNRQVEVRPAEAGPGETMSFYGAELASDQTSLVLQGPTLSGPVEVTSQWSLSATTNRVFATVPRFAGAQPLLPGVYSAMIKVDRQLTTPDGRAQHLVQTSNAVAFLITPNLTTPDLTTVATADAAGIVVVQGWLFKAAGLAPENLKVLVGSAELPLETTAALTPGHFEVVDGTTLVPPVILDDASLPFVIRFRFPVADLVSGDTVPLRVVINGGENAPRWVKVP